jgi:hypothetical protein
VLTTTAPSTLDNQNATAAANGLQRNREIPGSGTVFGISRIVLAGIAHCLDELGSSDHIVQGPMDQRWRREKQDIDREN